MNDKLKKNFYLLTSTCLISGSLLFTGCSYQPDISYNNGAKDPLSSFVNTLKPQSSDKVKSNSSQTDNLIVAQQVLDASVEEIPTLTAVGYAVVSTQPGRSDAQKR